MQQQVTLAERPPHVRLELPRQTSLSAPPQPQARPQGLTGFLPGGVTDSNPALGERCGGKPFKPELPISKLRNDSAKPSKNT
jgi:hypothetical protein